MNKLRNKMVAAVLLAVMAIMPAAVQAEDGARAPGNSQRTEQRENLERETEYNDVFRKDDAEETAEDWLPDIVEEREREEHGYIGRVKDEERNLNELVFRNADGSSTMRVYSHPVKYIAQDGSIKDISLLLEEQADGFRPKGHAVRTSFAHRLSAGIGLEYEDISITLIPEGDGTGELSSDGRKVGYEINSKTRIEYELTYAGYKEDIVVKEYTGQTEYRFLLRTELDICADEYGQYRLLDGSGRVRARIGEILIVTADERNNSWGELKCEQTMPGEYLLKVILDEEYLRNAKTAYPIRIDPTIEINYDSSGAGAIEDVTINQGRTYAGDSGSISVGRNADGKLSRALMRFPGLSLTGIAAQSITAASVEIRDLMCQDDEDFTIDCHIYSISAPIWSEAGSTSWSGVGNAYLGAKLDSHLVSYGKGNAGAHRYSFNIITAARAWAYGTQLASRGLVFKASDSFEGQTGSGIKTWHKTFASYNRSSNRPSLSITYTSPISLNYSRLYIPEGVKRTITAVTYPSGASVTWSSSNTTVATVSSAGVVTAGKAGTSPTTITARITVNGTVYTASCTVYTVMKDGVYYIQNENSGYYLHVEDGKTKLYTDVQQYSKYAENVSELYKIRQLWKVKHLGNGKYSIRPMHKLTMGLAFDATNNNVSLYYCNTADTISQVTNYAHWTIDYSPSGYILRRDGYQKYTMKIKDSSTAIGATVVVGQDDNNKNCRWNLQRLDSPPAGVVFYNTANDAIIHNIPIKYTAIEESRRCESMDILAVVYSEESILQNVEWISSNSSIATVNTKGEITGISEGSATITARRYLNGSYKSASYTVKVTGISNGVYYIQNRASGRYADIKEQAMSQGTVIHQWDFHGYGTQQWVINHMGDGYYSISSGCSLTPYYLGVSGDSTANDAAVVLRSGNITDGMKWKVEKTTQGAFRITPKTGEGNNRVLAVGVYAFNINGIAIQQRDYIADDNYKDEWFITGKKTFASIVNNYFDNGYPVYYNESNSESINAIKGYIKSVADRYEKLFGLRVAHGDAVYYRSLADICKGTVTSSNIDKLCNHSGDKHTDRHNVVFDLHTNLVSNSTTTNVFWTCHKIASVSAGGSTQYNRSCAYANTVAMLTRSRRDESDYIKAALMHELNHQYGAPDHYHELRVENDTSTCIHKDNCSVCGDLKRSKTCIMDQVYDNDIQYGDLVCYGCRGDIMRHLAEHHQ